jgi:TolB-like protein/Tfp pilus assembly protein PilF
LVFQFNHFTLDTAQYRLCLSGKPVAVEPQVFDLLVYLINNRERVVTRDELFENLWKGKVVTDAALGVRLKDARKAVGDSGDRQAVIKTFTRRGYQFIARTSVSNGISPMVEVDQAEALHSPMRAKKPSIAVLPLQDLSGDSGQNYYADGIAEDIIANLCRYRELFVIDHSSTFTYGHGGSDSKRIAAELGIEYLARGNIRRSGEKIRISVQLVEAQSGKAIWAERIDRDMNDIFALEDEVAARIAASLVSHIEDEVSVRATRKHPENMSAFDYELRGRRHAQSYNQELNFEARELLRKAIELDPDYAAAYASLACSYCVESEAAWGGAREEVLKQACNYARKAVELDGFDSAAHAAMGKAYLAMGKFELAEAHLDRAIECNPNSYGAFCAKSWLLAFAGRTAEVRVCGTTALSLNPLAPDECLMSMVVASYSERNYEAALERLSRIQRPDANSEAWRAACLAQLGRGDESRVAARNAIAMGGDFVQHENWLKIWTFKEPSDREHFAEGLVKAGIQPVRNGS